MLYRAADPKSKKRIALIIQARMCSQRLPGKMMLKVCDKPIIQRVLERCNNSALSDMFILACPESAENNILSDFGHRIGFSVFRGKEEDVLDRFYQAARSMGINSGNDIIVRVCADNPFVDPYEIDRLIGFYLKGNYDYTFNHIPALDNMYPDGLGAEAFSFSILQHMWKHAKDSACREHTTKYIWDNQKKFKYGVLKAPACIAYPDIKLDVDTHSDFAQVEGLYKELILRNSEIIFSGTEIVDCARKLGLCITPAR